MRNDCQNGKPVHHPTITRPGSTKMIAESVPAADATVCTMLFSRIDESLKALRIAIEITAAGIDDAKVRPTLRPRYTLAAVKTVVISEPRIRPRMVSSRVFMGGNGTPSVTALTSPVTALAGLFRMGRWGRSAIRVSVHPSHHAEARRKQREKRGFSFFSSAPPREPWASAMKPRRL